MSGPAYVYEIEGYPDQAARGEALKATIEEWWPGSVVELRPHPMGSLRARITLIDEDADNEFRTTVYLRRLAEGFRLFADRYGRHDL